LVTKGTEEPYRMFTSRAEYRLILRQDNCDERLMPTAFRLGTVSAERYDERRRFWDRKREVAGALEGVRVPAAAGSAVGGSVSARDLLKRPEAGIDGLAREVAAVGEMLALRGGDAGVIDTADVSDDMGIDIDTDNIDTDNTEEFGIDTAKASGIDRHLALGVESDIKYEGFVRKQTREIERIRRYEETKIPDGFSYDGLPGLLTESRQKFKKIRPATLGAASRISGVTPADVSVLAMYLLKRK
jgi:tRNA uridine 5-carboxymethylaminomethyl modification enzyme